MKVGGPCSGPEMLSLCLQQKNAQHMTNSGVGIQTCLVQKFI